VKTTKELYGIDPKVLANMTYKEVLDLKRQAAEHISKEAKEKLFKLPQIGYLEEASEYNATIKEAKKALKYIKLWQDEIK
jgi:hypothetical protein